MCWRVLGFDFVPFIFVHNSVKFHYENWMRPVVKGGETFLSPVYAGEVDDQR